MSEEWFMEEMTREDAKQDFYANLTEEEWAEMEAFWQAEKVQ